MAWSREIVDDLEDVIAGKQELDKFVAKHWERFKPVYINFHKYCDDEGELYLLVHEFFSKIVRSDVQPLFLSDNQLFNYFKTAVRNRHYDNTHKKELNLITFTDYCDGADEGEDYEPIENTIVDEAPSGAQIKEEEIYVEEILDALSHILPEHCMKLLVLLYKKGLSPQEARKELGVNLTTVRDRISVIREIVKANLDYLELEEKVKK